MKVLLAEPDKMFRLISAALRPDQADLRFLADFFLSESSDPHGMITQWSLKRGIPPDLDVVIAADEADFVRQLPDADVVVLEKQTVSSAHLESARNLRLIQVFGRDASSVDKEACRRHDAELRTLERNTNHMVAEHTVMMMLALTHRLDASRQAMADPSAIAPGNWAYNWPSCQGVKGLAGLTVGLIGMGEVAQLVAAYLRPFGVHVIYTRRNRNPDLERELGMRFVNLPALLAQSDIVSLHVPGGAATGQLLDKDALARVKSGAFLVNTSRGSLIDENALADALRDGSISGAALDVFAVEPLPLDHVFHQVPGMILTPHLAAGSRGDPSWLDVEIGPVVDAIVKLHDDIAPSSSA